MTTEPNPTIATIDRAIESLLKLRAWAERHGDNIAPIDREPLVFFHTDNTDVYHATIEAAAELVDLSDPDAIDAQPESFSTKIDVPGLRVRVMMPYGVCQRIQTGTKLVERPAPDAPTITVEEPVYEWACTE